MHHTVEMVLPSEATDETLAALEKIEGVLALSVERDSGIKPPGDVVTVHALNRSIDDVLAAASHAQEYGPDRRRDRRDLEHRRHRGAGGDRRRRRRDPLGGVRALAAPPRPALGELPRAHGPGRRDRRRGSALPAGAPGARPRRLRGARARLRAGGDARRGPRPAQRLRDPAGRRLDRGRLPAPGGGRRARVRRAARPGDGLPEDPREQRGHAPDHRPHLRGLARRRGRRHSPGW